MASKVLLFVPILVICGYFVCINNHQNWIFPKITQRNLRDRGIECPGNLGPVWRQVKHIRWRNSKNIRINQIHSLENGMKINFFAHESCLPVCCSGLQVQRDSLPQTTQTRSFNWVCLIPISALLQIVVFKYNKLMYYWPWQQTLYWGKLWSTLPNIFPALTKANNKSWTWL